MKRTANLLLTALALLASACGGGDKYDRVANEVIEKSDAVTELLLKIQDPASAQKHEAELMSAIGDLKEYADEQEGMEEPPKERQAELEARMRPSMEAMAKEMMRVIMDPELQQSMAPMLQQVAAQ